MNQKAIAKEACEAHSGLFVLGAVIGMLEGGAVIGGSDGIEGTAQKIIAMCKKEQQRQLRRMDLMLSKIKDTPK